MMVEVKKEKEKDNEKDCDEKKNGKGFFIRK